MKLVQHPQIDHKYLVTKVIEPIAKTTFDKVPQRILMTRMEVY